MSADVMSPTSAAENLVAQGATLMRIENDSMLAVAVQRPRNEANVLKGALNELAMVPEEAKKNYYAIPYKDRDTGKIVTVTGPSINAAMALARRWGNCSAATRIVNEDATGFDIEGVFIDLESNFRVSKPFRVGKTAKRKGGGAYILDPQRLLMAVQAGASKASRNAILAGLPTYLVRAYDTRAREIAAGNLDAAADPKKVAGLFRAFERFKVTKEMLEAYVEMPIADWTGETLSNLIGLGNALNDGQVTLEDLFPPKEEPARQASGPAVVTPDSLVGATVTGEDGATPGDQKPAPAAAAPQCAHPKVPPSKVDALSVGKSIVCPDCKQELKRERQPGEDG